ncbi:MAG: hypothetical protein ACKO2P_10860, partial [Planctomycetota bacterium]
MKTQTMVIRLVCGSAVLLWTGVGFADDLANLLRLVQAVAQDRSGSSRSDRGGRERAQDAFSQPSGRTSREVWKRNQEQDWAEEQALERGSRVPSRSRVPAGSVRQPGSGRVEDRVDRGVRNDRFG